MYRRELWVNFGVTYFCHWNPLNIKKSKFKFLKKVFNMETTSINFVLCNKLSFQKFIARNFLVYYFLSISIFAFSQSQNFQKCAKIRTPKTAHKDEAKRFLPIRYFGWIVICDFCANLPYRYQISQFLNFWRKIKYTWEMFGTQNYEIKCPWKILKCSKISKIAKLNAREI